jgi:hypothetical protein
MRMTYRTRGIWDNCGGLARRAASVAATSSPRKSTLAQAKASSPGTSRPTLGYRSPDDSCHGLASESPGRMSGSLSLSGGWTAARRTPRGHRAGPARRQHARASPTAPESSRSWRRPRPHRRACTGGPSAAASHKSARHIGQSASEPDSGARCQQEQVVERQGGAGERQHDHD